MSIPYTGFTHPQGRRDVEDYELSEQRVDLAQQESVKAFLDRSTREALENQVRGIELVAFVLDMQGEYVFSTRKDVAKRRSNRKDRKAKRRVMC